LIGSLLARKLRYALLFGKFLQWRVVADC